MSQLKIVTCFPIGASQVARIRDASPDCDVVVATQDSIAADLMQADVFCGHAKVPIDWQAIVNQGRLKWIQSSAAGLDHCLSPEVIQYDIVVSGCSGLFAQQVAEQTLALMFGLIRSMSVFMGQQLRHEFVRRPTMDFHGKSVGILGLGGNGMTIARILRPMAGRIEATDCFHEELSKNDELNGIVDVILAPDKTDEVLGRSDVVIVTLPLTDATSGFIDRKRFRAMKKDAVFLNVGRGKIVNHDALTECLLDKHLVAAGLDVCDPEPLPVDHPLWDMPNVLITPHVGAQSAVRVPSTVTLFCENITRWGKEQPLLNLVDKQLGFPRPENRLSFEVIGSLLKKTAKSK